MDSHWNLSHLKGKEIDVVTFTNCPTVELVLNDKSLGTKQLGDFPDKMMIWKVPYQPGRIEARGIEKGRTVCSYELRTAGEAKQIHLVPDRTTIRADSRDLCHVEVKVTDSKGIIVPTADNLIHFTALGAGRIIGVDNGDLTSTEFYKANERKVFHGRGLVVLQSISTVGELILQAHGEGLAKAEVAIDVR
jgi:beta-galactosidase